MIQTSRVLIGDVKRTEGLAGTAEKADNSFGSFMVLKISSRKIRFAGRTTNLCSVKAVHSLMFSKPMRFKDVELYLFSCNVFNSVVLSDMQCIGRHL